MNMLTLSKAQIQCMGGSSGTPVAYFICLFIYLLYTAHSQVPSPNNSEEFIFCD